MKLTAKLTERKAGIFDVIADGCPIADAAKTMDLPAPHCCDGIITNVQGPVILKRCKWTHDDSLSTEGKQLFCNCRHEKASPQ